MNTELLLSTILMLKKSSLKDYLYKIMKNINILKIQNHFADDIVFTENIIEDIIILLENMDDWIRNYNSSTKMLMNKELMSNLLEIKKMFQVQINYK